MTDKTIFQEDIHNSQDPEKRTKFLQALIDIYDGDLKNWFDLEEEQKINPNKEDFSIELKDGTKIKIDRKDQTSYWNGKYNIDRVCLERKQDINNVNNTGWTFTITKKGFDKIIFVWVKHNELTYLLVDAPKLEVWFINNKDNYKLCSNKVSVDNITGNTWRSLFSPVPIRDLPLTCVEKWVIKGIEMNNEKFNELYDWEVYNSGY